MMRALLRNKPLHFVLGGTLLYALHAQAPQQAIEPLVLAPAVRAQLLAGFTAEVGRAPDAAEAAALERRELDDELLFREALARGVDRRDPVVRQRLLLDMRFLGDSEGRDDEALLRDAYAAGLHRNDVVVRRRLVQVMEFALSEGAEASPATPAELAAMYAARKDELTEPERWRLTQVYFSGEKRGAQLLADANAVRARLVAGAVAPGEAIASGDPFLGGHELPALAAAQLAAQFGADFVQDLQSCELRQWCGPLRSSFGLHLAWIEQHEPARLPAPEEPEVRRRLEADVQRERSERRLAEAMQELRRRYGVAS